MTSANERKSGFTPIFDEVASAHGLVAAAVFGVIWRHSQMRHRACHASTETLSRLTGMGRSTVRAKIALLIEQGLIVKVRGPAKHEPPWYVCTYRPEVIEHASTRLALPVSDLYADEA